MQLRPHGRAFSWVTCAVLVLAATGRSAVPRTSARLGCGVQTEVQTAAR